jgi:hypothetical protein
VEAAPTGSGEQIEEVHAGGGRGQSALLG